MFRVAFPWVTDLVWFSVPQSKAKELAEALSAKDAELAALKAQLATASGGGAPSSGGGALSSSDGHSSGTGGLPHEGEVRKPHQQTKTPD